MIPEITRPKSTDADIAFQERLIRQGGLVVLEGEPLTRFQELLEQYAPSLEPEQRQLVTGFYDMISTRRDESGPLEQMVKPKIGPPTLRAEYRAENHRSPLTFIPRETLQSLVPDRKLNR